MPPPVLAKRYPTNDRMLQYDPLIADTVSKCGNKNTQVCASSYGWTHAYDMQKKSDAHKMFSVLFQHDGVSPAMVMDGSKEQTLGNFHRKLLEADCQKREIEPHSTWLNAAELNIRELKRGSSYKMLKSRSSKLLWNHCLELHTLICTHTAHNIYALNEDTPRGR